MGLRNLSFWNQSLFWLYSFDIELFLDLRHLGNFIIFIDCLNTIINVHISLGITLSIEYLMIGWIKADFNNFDLRNVTDQVLMVLELFEDVLLLGNHSFCLDDSQCHSCILCLYSLKLLLSDVMGEGSDRRPFTGCSFYDCFPILIHSCEARCTWIYCYCLTHALKGVVLST